MGQLINTFSWSVSAANDFEECRRRRYWSKYAAWEGWDARAPSIRKAAYRLNKMDSRHTLQGKAVEAAVMWTLREKQAGRDVSVEAAYERAARPLLNRCWKESREKQWESDPKRCCNLHEHYYPELHATPDKEWTGEVIRRTKQCIRNFIERVLPRLASVRPEQEVPVGQPDGASDPESFEFEGVKVYALPDYVYRVDGQWHIHDWKSGKPKPEHEWQVSIYGLWANQKHGVSPERIYVYVEYLYDGAVAVAQLGEERLAAVQERIRHSVADMREYLVDGDVARNEPLAKEDWELAAERSACRRCKFFELCRPELEAQ